MSKKFLSIMSLVLVAVMLCGVFAGCNNEEEGKKDSFTTVLTSEPATLSVFDANDYVAWGVMNNIYDALIDFEQDGSIDPGLAESWDYSDDGTEITFHLRKDVKFQNGNKFDADDVVFTYEKQIANPNTSNNTSAMVKMEKIDDYTTKLTLKHSFGPIEHCVGGFMLFIADKETYEADPESYTRKPIGTGAYKVVDWVAGDKITLTRNDDYYWGKPAIKDVTYNIVADMNTNVISLENHEIDYLDSIPTSEVENIKSNAELGYVEAPSPSTYFFCMNNSTEPFNKKELRLAVEYAIDKEAIMKGAINDMGVLNNTPMAHNIVGWPKGFEAVKQDVAKAAQLVKDAGYPNGVTVECLIMPSASYTKPAEIIQEQLSKVGITMTIKTMERAAFLTEMVGNKQYTCSVMSATAFYPDSDYIYNLYYTAPVEGRNYTMCSNAKLDELLDAARVEPDKATREKLYKEICELWLEEAFTVPLYIPNQGTGYDKDLQGVKDNANRKLFIRNFSWASGK